MKKAILLAAVAVSFGFSCLMSGCTREIVVAATTPPVVVPVDSTPVVVPVPSVWTINSDTYSPVTVTFDSAQHELEARTASGDEFAIAVGSLPVDGAKYTAVSYAALSQGGQLGAGECVIGSLVERGQTGSSYFSDGISQNAVTFSLGTDGKWSADFSNVTVVDGIQNHAVVSGSLHEQ